MTPLEKALVRLDVDLRELGLEWALVGGIAVGVRSEPRTTRDLDVAIAVRDDREAESIIRSFSARGYRAFQPLEQTDTGRLATVRLRAPGGDADDPVIVDLLFASSGIEPEIVTAAEPLELPPRLVVPVATTAHLLALKTLATRPKDQIDFQALKAVASSDDRAQAKEAPELIERRGFHRGKNLALTFTQLLEGMGIAEY